MKALTRISIVMFALLAWSASPVSAADAFKLVVNSANPVTSIDRKDAAKFFVKRSTSWDDGESVSPVDQAPDSSVRESFSESVHGRSVTAVKSFWQKQIFSGRSVPPPEVTGDAAVIDYVKKNRGAIGYVSADADTNGVKTVTVTD